MVKTSPSNAGDTDLILDQGAKISLASLPKNQSIKQKQYCNKSNNDFKKWSISKNKNIENIYNTPNFSCVLSQ